MSTAPPPVRLALLGTGAAAAVHADAAAAAGIPVTAIVGRRRRSGRDLAEATGAPLTRLDDLPELADVVLVATDPASHGPLAGRVLDLGLPVVVERPLALSVAAATALAGRGAVAAENLRHAPLVRAVLARGGTPVDVEVRVRRPRPGWGFWPGTPALPALLVDLLAPGVALAVDALALGAPVGDSRGPGLPSDAVLLASTPTPDVVRIDLRTGGRRARIEAAWTATPLVDLQIAGNGFVSRAELLPHPVLEFDGQETAAAEDEPDDPLHTLGYVGQLRSVLPVLAAAAPGTPAADPTGVTVVAVLAAALASIDTGVVVELAGVAPERPLLQGRR